MRSHLQIDPAMLRIVPHEEALRRRALLRDPRPKVRPGQAVAENVELFPLPVISTPEEHLSRRGTPPDLDIVEWLEVAPSEKQSRRLNEWEQIPLLFDEHVISWRVYKELLETVEDRKTPVITAKDYVKKRARDFGMTYTDITGDRRDKFVIKIRHILMYEVIQKFGSSTTRTGKIFGGRDHTTVIHALKNVETRLKIGYYKTSIVDGDLQINLGD